MERKLKGSEEFFHVLHKNFGFLLAAAVTIESDVDIEFEQIRRRFKQVADNHTILKTRILSDKNGAAQSFSFELNEQFSPDVEEASSSSSDWQLVLEDSLLQPLDTDNGPLWRVRVLQSVKDDNKYQRTIVVTFHHAIADGKAMVGFCLEVVQGLNGELPFKEHPMILSLHKRLGDKVKNNWMAKKFVSMVVSTYLVRMLRGNGENPLFSLFPETSESTQAALRRTKVIPFRLDADTTLRLLTLSKVYAVSTEGLVAAITARAFKRFADINLADKGTAVESINFGFILDMRQRVQNEPDEQGLTCCGCYVSRIPLSLKITYCNDSQSFWASAQDSTKEIQQCSNNEQDLENYKMMNLIGGKKEELIKGEAELRPNGRLGNDLFNICYAGEYAQKDGEGVQLKEFYLAAAEHQAGPTFANNVVVLNGHLCWTLTYFPHVSGEKIAEDIQGLISEEIKIALQ